MTKIVDQDAYDKAKILLHKAYGGDLGDKDTGTTIKAPLFNFGNKDYVIVGPSRVPFDAIQWMKGGGVCVDDSGFLWSIKEGHLHVKEGNKHWQLASENNHTWFFYRLTRGDLKPHTEENTVVWRDPETMDQFKIENGSYRFAPAGIGDFHDCSGKSAINILEEIAQGKWERVDE